MNPYLFAVGCPRSGTTLLQRMLDSHPQLAVANDVDFIPRAIEGLTGPADLLLTPELVARAQSFHRFARLQLPQEAVDQAAAGARTYREFVTALYDEYGRRRGKPLAGQKTPTYVRHLPCLHALFPWARVIHIIRDGRDAALSIMEWSRDGKGPCKMALWQEEPLAVCALWWRWQVRMGQGDGVRLGKQAYMDIAYESLVARSEETLRKLTDFLDLPFAPEMLEYYEGKTRNDPGLSAKNAWLPPTTGLRDWRTQMSTRDVALFEALAGDLLSALGYERGADSIPAEVQEVAARCRQWWRDEMARRQSHSAPASRLDLPRAVEGREAVEVGSTR
jgi:hypothetical protein